MTSKHSLFALLLGSTLLVWDAHSAAQRGQPSGPPMPFEDVGACPFEGCVYREWTVESPVNVRTARRQGAPIAFTLSKGDRVQAITGIVVTTRPGRVQFRQPIDLSTTSGLIKINPGETLYLLTYHGEGVTTGWFKGRLYDEVDGQEFFNGLCGRRTICNGTIVEKPRTVWWVRVRNKARVTGWTNEPEKFGNKDRFG